MTRSTRQTLENAISDFLEAVDGKANKWEEILVTNARGKIYY